MRQVSTDDGDNIYEGEVSFANNQVNFQCGTRPPPRASAPQNTQYEYVNQNCPQATVQTYPVQEQKKESKANRWKIIEVIIGITAVLLLMAIVVQMNLFMVAKQNTKPDTGAGFDYQYQSSTPSNATNHETPKSCLDLRNLGKTRNGIYVIKPDSSLTQYQVYCDMETNDGGWTLVASIHEDDIKAKCNDKDRWASYVEENKAAPAEKTNWENKRVFGRPEKCTEDDYKNSAYYSLQAQNVMVWHVPSGSPIKGLKKYATLRYRTTNNFLQTTGGTLRSLYTDYYPLVVNKGYQRYKAVANDRRTEVVLEALEKNGGKIKAHISNWYSYVYPSGSTNYISDGTLYSSHGNMLRKEISVRIALH